MQEANGFTRTVIGTDPLKQELYYLLGASKQQIKASLNAQNSELKDFVITHIVPQYVEQTQVITPGKRITGSPHIVGISNQEQQPAGNFIEVLIKYT